MTDSPYNQFQRFNLEHQAALAQKAFIGEFFRRCGYVCTIPTCGMDVSPLALRHEKDVTKLLCRAHAMTQRKVRV